ncbi:MAG: hypothetical protein NTZ64_10725 [Polaromonas sp.]|nr:hypothetical protein [Polaromonas sp.]
MTNTPQNPLNTQVLCLVSWPSLQHLLGGAAPHITRICALLARRPSVGMLIPVILNIPPHVAHPLLEMLYADGYIRPAGPAAAPLAPAPKAESAPSPDSTSDSSFLAKLWQHLVNKK